MRILVIGGGLFQDFAVKKAKELGFFTICADMDDKSLGSRSADFFINESTRDHKRIIQVLKNNNIFPDGVITVGTDMSRTVYHVSREFGLDPGFEDPECLVNKISMRKKLKESGIPQPEFIFSDDVNDIIYRRKQSGLEFPLVLKPSENMGARGVVKVSDDNDIKRNFPVTRKYALDGKVILEQYMEGPELSVECIVYKGKCHVLVIGDRHIEREPYFVETGHSCPSRMDKDIIKSIPDFMQKAANALGIFNGPCKGDIKITDGKLMVGEIAGRLSGGFMSSHTLPLSTGIDAIGLNIRQRLGLEIESSEFRQVLDKICIERAIIPQNTGVIKNISGIDEALKIDGVEYIHINLEQGSRFSELVSNIGKVGNIVISANDFESAENTFRKCINTVKVEII